MYVDALYIYYTKSKFCFVRYHFILKIPQILEIRDVIYDSGTFFFNYVSIIIHIPIDR